MALSAGTKQAKHSTFRRLFGGGGRAAGWAILFFSSSVFAVSPENINRADLNTGCMRDEPAQGGI